MHDIAHCLRPGHLAAAPQHPRRPRGVGQRPLRGPRPAEERQHRRPAGCCRCARTPAPPSSRARRASACSPAAATRRPSPGASSRPTRRDNLRYSQMAPLTMWDEQNTGPTCRPRSSSPPSTATSLQVPVHGQGRRLGQQELPVPGDQGAAEPRAPAAPSSTRSCAPLGTAACPPYHLAVVIGGTSAEFALETAKLASRPLPRHAAHRGLAAGPRLPRPRAGGRGPEP